ncbi:hypothetical protein BJV77DRAFT_349013 [Russula vinacea]|nr:hypothetical protein BJV77DRAFT_349013 [Russula vinacea]
MLTHVTRYFSEHVLGFPACALGLVPFPLPFPLCLPDPSFAREQNDECVWNGCSPLHSSAADRRQHRVGGFGHTPIRRVVFVISASRLLRPHTHSHPRVRPPQPVSGTAAPSPQPPGVNTSRRTVSCKQQRFLTSRSLADHQRLEVGEGTPENLKTSNDLNQGRSDRSAAPKAQDIRR